MKIEVSIHEGMKDKDGNHYVVILNYENSDGTVGKWPAQYAGFPYEWLKFPAHKGPTFIECESMVDAIRIASHYYETGEITEIQYPHESKMWVNGKEVVA
tara:strand:+ start:122 stop:421 length:300 start_codon:yes stop_codon:yes gene_type:complete